MALIKCPECGKEVSDKANKCIGCGFPILNINQEVSQEDVKALYKNVFTSGKRKKENFEKRKNEMTTARLVISILMLIFSVIVLFQSCAAGLVNAVENNGNTDGGTGLIIFLLMIIFGTIGIATKNTKSYIVLLVCATIACLIFMYCVFAYEGIFADLKVWGWLFGIYSFIFSFSGSAVRANKKYLAD